MPHVKRTSISTIVRTVLGKNPALRAKYFVPELRRRTGLSRSTIYEHLLSFELQGKIHREKGRYYLPEQLDACRQRGKTHYDWLVKLIWEADQNGLNFVSPSDFPNLYYGVKTQNLDWPTATAHANGLNHSGDCVYFATSVDEFTSSSINASIWTLGTSGGASQPDIYDGRLRLSASSDVGYPAREAWVCANGSSATDYAAGTQDKEILLHVAGCNDVAQYDESNPYMGFCLGDCSSTVELCRWSGKDNWFDAYTKVGIHGQPVSRADVYVNGALMKQNIDLTSLSHWYPYFMAHADGDRSNSAELYVDYVRHVVGDVNSTSFCSTTKTVGEPVTAATMFAKSEENGGSFVYQISGDGGIHYETMVLGEPHELAYLGNQLKVKIVGTEPANPDAAKEDNTPIVEAWAVLWNPS